MKNSARSPCSLLRVHGRRNGGFTLIEVMVAILVLAFGLLALAGLQLQMLRFSQSATLRTIATAQAASLADHVLSNRERLDAGDYNQPVVGVATPEAACMTAAGCTPTQLANMGMYMWNESIRGLLGRTAGGTICRDSIPNDGTLAAPACDNVSGAPYVIKIWWTDERSGVADQGRFVTSLQP